MGPGFGVSELGGRQNGALCSAEARGAPAAPTGPAEVGEPSLLRPGSAPTWPLTQCLEAPDNLPRRRTDRQTEGSWRQPCPGGHPQVRDPLVFPESGSLAPGRPASPTPLEPALRPQFSARPRAARPQGAAVPEGPRAAPTSRPHGLGEELGGESVAQAGGCGEAPGSLTGGQRRRQAQSLC